MKTNIFSTGMDRESKTAWEKVLEKEHVHYLKRSDAVNSLTEHASQQFGVYLRNLIQETKDQHKDKTPVNGLIFQSVDVYNDPTDLHNIAVYSPNLSRFTVLHTQTDGIYQFTFVRNADNKLFVAMEGFDEDNVGVPLNIIQNFFNDSEYYLTKPYELENLAKIAYRFYLENEDATSNSLVAAYFCIQHILCENICVISLGNGTQGLDSPLAAVTPDGDLKYYAYLPVLLFHDKVYDFANNYMGISIVDYRTKMSELNPRLCAQSHLSGNLFSNSAIDFYCDLVKAARLYNLGWEDKSG